MRQIFLSITLTLLCFLSFNINAAEPPGSASERLDYLPESEYQLLMEKYELSRELSNGDDLTLIPLISESSSGSREGEDIIRIQSEMKRFFGIEGLFFLPDDHSKLTSGETDALYLDIYNLTRGVSTLEGTDYYSASRGYRRTLFHRFFRIEEPGSRSPLPDPVVSAIPDSDTFLAFQEDCTFGEDEYEIKYDFTPPAIDLTMKNTTSLNYKFIPIAGKEKLYMYVRIIPVDEGWIFYGNCLVEGRKVPIPGKNINDSLYNRIKALMEWFSKRIETEIQ